MTDEEVMHLARQAAAKFWSDRAAAMPSLCGKRDAEVIIAGGADKSADVQAARNAILIMLALDQRREAA